MLLFSAAKHDGKHADFYIGFACDVSAAIGVVCLNFCPLLVAFAFKHNVMNQYNLNYSRIILSCFNCALKTTNFMR